MRASKCIVFLIVAAAASGPAIATAQPAGAQAEALFRRGKELMAHGKTGEACGAFDASQKLDPTTSTQLNRAACREKNGQLATAWGLFLEAERMTRAATDAPTRELHKVAQNRAAKLEARLSTLTISVPAESQMGGLEILRDGEEVDAAAWNQALPTDGGTYRISARAPGNAEWSSTITVGAERDVKSIEIPRLRRAMGSRPPTEPVVEPTRPAASPVPLVPVPQPPNAADNLAPPETRVDVASPGRSMRIA